MTSHSALSIRRGQLISPFGVGSLSVGTDGVSMICGALDYWFRDVDDVDEFKVEEWRLQDRLATTHFRLPPDFRQPQRGSDIQNANVTIPFFRFPAYHYCDDCGRLEKKNPLTAGRLRCPECEREGKLRTMVQAPLVAICEHGHLQDFPWTEWVHRSSNAVCDKTLRLRTTGGASLSAMKVACDCGAEPRPLGRVTSAGAEGTFLSSALEPGGAPFLCAGHKPWLGPVPAAGCGSQLRGSQRSASNLYFAEVVSAIYLPQGSSLYADLLEVLRGPIVGSALELVDPNEPSEVTAARLIANHRMRAALADFDTAYLEGNLAAALSSLDPEPEERNGMQSRPHSDLPSEAEFRRPERTYFLEGLDSRELTVRSSDPSAYKTMKPYFSAISLVERLRETRVLTGFSRVSPPPGSETGQRDNAVTLVSPWGLAPSDPWLPAYVVFGEGIYLELDRDALGNWESSRDAFIRPRIERLANEQQRLRGEGRTAGHRASARFVLVHTLAHLLIRELTYACGYSSASLRERLYVSDDAERPMAGILIYTAAGDSEGTLGGLVRMAEPSALEPVFRQAVMRSLWCSADPVCMEIGAHSSQGTDSLNLAACHNCCLVPETACEHFNRLLDRSLVIGDLQDPGAGFFSSFRGNGVW